MGPQSDLELFKEKAAAVQVVITEIPGPARGLRLRRRSYHKAGGQGHGCFRLGRPKPRPWRRPAAQAGVSLWSG